MKAAAAVGLMVAGVILGFGALLLFPAGSNHVQHGRPIITGISSAPGGSAVNRSPAFNFALRSQTRRFVYTPRSQRASHSSSQVSISVAVGYGNQYRWLTTVPVTVSAHNKTSSAINGTIVVPARNEDPSSGYTYGPRTVYQTSVVLPPGATKHVTLYVPAWSLGYEVDARLRSAGRVIASAYTNPSALGSTVFSVGAVTDNTLDTSWLSRVQLTGGESTRIVRLPASGLDANALALQNFGSIVLEDGAVAGLTSAQQGALRSYVANGGGLILIGGAGWQQSIKPLPSWLRTGSVRGTTQVPDLRGLAAIEPVGTAKNAPQAALVSVVRSPVGKVLASQGGVPLVVDRTEGSGHIIYLAFDPGVNPVAGWSSAGKQLGRILIRSDPQAAALGPDWSSANSLLSPSPFFDLPGGYSSDLADELRNIPSAALASVILFVVLAAVFVLVLGPLLFALLRLRGKVEWMWAALPLGALLSMGATFGMGQVTQSRTAIANTVGVLTLTGSQQARPASFYTGVFAPLAGSYRLTYHSAGVPVVVPDPQAAADGPVAMRLQQDGNTTDAFMPHMGLWSMRSLGLTTTIPLRGDVEYRIGLADNGHLTGWVRNNTSLDLIRPAIIAGQTFERLPSLGPGASTSIRVAPETNVRANSKAGSMYTTVWNRAYGQYGAYYAGYGCYGCYGGGGHSYYDANPPTGQIRSVPSLGPGPPTSFALQGGYGGGCCFGIGPFPEHSLVDRFRDVATQMPDAQRLDTLGDVLFVGWTQQPIAPLTINGDVPNRRDLTLVVKPLSVALPPGPFAFHTGTFGANLVDVTPASPNQRNCCSGPSTTAVELGSGGAATYEFDLGGRGTVHLSRLSVYVNAGGASGRDMGRVWDWRQDRWTSFSLYRDQARLAHPQNFVSPQHAVLIKLVTHDTKTDMYFPDARENIQITGSGWTG